MNTIFECIGKHYTYQGDGSGTLNLLVTPFIHKIPLHLTHSYLNMRNYHSLLNHAFLFYIMLPKRVSGNIPRLMVKNYPSVNCQRTQFHLRVSANYSAGIINFIKFNVPFKCKVQILKPWRTSEVTRSSLNENWLQLYDLWTWPEVSGSHIKELSLSLNVMRSSLEKTCRTPEEVCLWF